MKFKVLLTTLLLLPAFHAPAEETFSRAGSPCAADTVQVISRREQKLKISGGPSAAFISSNFVHSPMDGGRSIMKYGFGVGGFIDMGIKEWFSVQAELTLGYGMSEFTRLGKTGTYRHIGLELPIYAMFHICLKDNGRVNLGIGPFTDFGLYGSYETVSGKHDVYVRDEATGLSTMKDNYSGIAMKIGYEFRSGLQLNCSYKISASNVLDENSSEVRMHPQAASFEVAYRF